MLRDGASERMDGWEMERSRIHECMNETFAVTHMAQREREMGRNGEMEKWNALIAFSTLP